MGLTNNLALALQATNSNPGTWGSNLNANVITLLDNALGGTTTINAAGNSNIALTTLQAGNLIHNISGVLTGNIQYIFPAGTGRFVIIDNATTGAFTITVLTAGGTGVIVPQGSAQIVEIDSSTNTATLLLSTSGALLKTNNLSDVSSAATSLSNLGGASLSANNTYTGTNAFSTATALTMAAGDNSTNVATDAYVQQSAPTRNFSNLQAAYSALSAFTVTCDSAVLANSSGNVVRVQNVSLTNTITGSGANGLDTGSAAINTNYVCYIIYNPTTSTTASLISLSYGSPTLPSGYTFYAAYGTIALNASAHIYSFRQYGNRMSFWVGGGNLSALPNLASGSAGNTGTPTWVSVNAVSYTLNTVPLKAVGLLLTAIGGASAAIVAPNNSYGGRTSTSNPPVMGVNTPSSVDGFATYWMQLEASNIYWASDQSTNYLWCLGYEYNW